jgi:AraC family transcriptional regulator
MMMFEDWVEINPPEHPLRGRNAIVSSLRNWHSPHEHHLPTSVKTALAGEIDIETRSARYRLSRERFLVVNAWERYSFKIAPGSTARTFSIFFRPRYVPSLEASLMRSHEALLDRDPNEKLPVYLELPETSYPATSCDIGRRLRALFDAWQREASQHCLADRFRSVTEALLRLRAGALSRVHGIDVAKASTRQELYRKSQLALIFVRENYGKDIDLNAVAREVGMAAHHLHRVFRAVEGATLHQRIVQFRLEKAKRLLQETEIPISRICKRVGYSSVPSFTRLFRSRFGKPPSAFRRWPEDDGSSGSGEALSG